MCGLPEYYEHLGDPFSPLLQHLKSIIVPILRRKKVFDFRREGRLILSQGGCFGKSDTWLTFPNHYTSTNWYPWRMGKRFTLMWGTLIRAQRISITIIIYIFNIMIIAINTIIFTIFTIFPIMKMMTNKGVCPNEPRGEGGVPGSSRVCSSGPRNLQGNPNSVENIVKILMCSFT